jgi:hypothetical protein
MPHGHSWNVVRRHPAAPSLILVLQFATGAAAQPIVLSGYTTSFTKLDDTNPTLPENQDPITSNVAITRGSGGGVYNALEESAFPPMDSSVIFPTFTQWATDINNPGQAENIAATNCPALTFDTWLNAYGGLMGAGPNTVGRNAVLRIIRSGIGLEDVYLDIRFTSWSVGGAGGFSYERAATPTGDYNGDGTVDAADYVAWRGTLNQTVAPGSGADGNLNRSIDAGDYAFWRGRFGNDVPTPASGVGAALAIPEPATYVVFLTGLLAFAARLRTVRIEVR